MTLAYEVVNFSFVVVQEWFHVFLVEIVGSLRTGQDQVQVCEETDPRVKRYPAKDEVESVLYSGTG